MTAKQTGCSEPSQQAPRLEQGSLLPMGEGQDEGMRDATSPGETPHPVPLPAGEGTLVPEAAGVGGASEVCLRVSGLNAYYGQAHILDGVDFTVETGRATALLGRNGAGKSTTVRSIMGLVAKRAGSIRFDGREMIGLETHRIARAGIGYVPEDRRIFTGLTVEENLLAGRQPPRDGLPEWTPERIYTLFPNLGHMRRRWGGQMSGGEQQMLTIGRTLMGNPSLLLLDEPSEGLAPKIVEQMAEAILDLKSQGISILLSEQNLHFARLICDRVAVLEKGRVQFSGSVAELDANPEARDAYLAV